MTEPLFIATESGARDVLRRARRRRRRHVAVTAAAVAAMTAVGAFAALPGAGAGADRLTVVPTSPTPGPARSEAHSAPAPARPASVATAQGSAAAGSATAAGQAAGVQAPLLGGTAPTPTAPARRHSAAAPIRRTTVAYRSGCDPTADVVGWCELYTGPSTARRKHPVTLSMELCRLPVAGDGSVTFADTREIDLEVLDGSGDTQWQAGQGERYRNTAHTVSVRAGTCLKWSSVWDTIAPDGFYAPPGDYSMSYAVDSDSFTYSTSGDVLRLTD